MDTIALTPTYGVHRESVRGIRVRIRPRAATYWIARQADGTRHNQTPTLLLFRAHNLTVSVGTKGTHPKEEGFFQ
jgi:hypothetical protein